MRRMWGALFALAALGLSACAATPLPIADASNPVLVDPAYFPGPGSGEGVVLISLTPTYECGGLSASSLSVDWLPTAASAPGEVSSEEPVAGLGVYPATEAALHQLRALALPAGWYEIDETQMQVDWGVYTKTFRAALEPSLRFEVRPAAIESTPAAAPLPKTKAAPESR